MHATNPVDSVLPIPLLENTDYIMNNTFFIGVYPGINDMKIDYIVGVFKKFFEEV